MKTTNSIKSRNSLQPSTLVYIMLITFTVMTWLVGKSGISGISVALAVLGFALFKAFLIGDYYMGLRGITGLWRWTIIIWLFLPGSLIAWAFISAG